MAIRARGIEEKKRKNSSKWRNNMIYNFTGKVTMKMTFSRNNR